MPPEHAITPTASAPDLSQSDPTYALLEDELSPAEQHQVDTTVAWLNQTARRHGVDHAVEVRDHILATFFDGDYGAFADPSRSKPRSLRALAQRPDLPYSFATLHALVRVGQQIEELPPGVGRGLSVKHHRALLAIANPELKAALAVEAAEGNLSSASLADRVREVRPKSNAGRPPLPPVVKHAHALRRTIGAFGVPAAETLRGLDEASKAELDAVLVEALERLAALREALAG